MHTAHTRFHQVKKRKHSPVHPELLVDLCRVQSLQHLHGVRGQSFPGRTFSWSRQHLPAHTTQHNHLLFCFYNFPTRSFSHSF